MPARLRGIEAVAAEYGIPISKPTGRGSHWKPKKPGHRTYPIPADKGVKTEIADKYINGFCRNFGIDAGEFKSKL